MFDGDRFGSTLVHAARLVDHPTVVDAVLAVGVALLVFAAWRRGKP